jgi:hypothetical protein
MGSSCILQVDTSPNSIFGNEYPDGSNKKGEYFTVSGTFGSLC